MCNGMFTAFPSGEYVAIRPFPKNCSFIYYSTRDRSDAKHFKAAYRTISNYLHTLCLQSAGIYLRALGCAKKIKIILTILATHFKPNKAETTRPENHSRTDTHDQTHATNNVQQNFGQNLHVPLTTNTSPNGNLENADTSDHWLEADATNDHASPQENTHDADKSRTRFITCNSRSMSTPEDGNWLKLLLHYKKTTFCSWMKHDRHRNKWGKLPKGPLFASIHAMTRSGRMALDVPLP
jgi:hypothetical protein